MNSEQCKRKNRAMRQRINELIAQGFVISKREPITLTMWPQTYEVRGPVLSRITR